MGRKPFAYVSKSGNVIRGDILEQYAVKEGSSQIDTADTTFEEDRVVSPPLPLSVLKQLPKENVYHNRAIQVKAGDRTQMGWELKAIEEDPSEEQKDKIYNFITNQPVDFIEQIFNAEVDFETFGYNFLEIVRTDDPDIPINVYHIPSYTVRFFKNREVAIQRVGNEKTYFIKYKSNIIADKEKGKVSSTNNQANEFYSDRKYAPGHSYYGFPDIVPAIGAIWGDVSRRNYNIEFFDNYAVPAYAVYITGNFDPGEVGEDGLTDLERDIEAKFKEIKHNPHASMILSIPNDINGGEAGVDVQFVPLSTEIKEASFRMYRMDNRDEVLASHGVPPYRLGIAETGSLGGSTAEASTEIYKRSIIETRQEKIERFINMLIQDAFGYVDWEFEFKNIDLEDEKSDLEMIKGIFSMGGITPNEVIGYFGWKYNITESSHPAMNYHYVNNIPIDADLPEGEEVDNQIIEEVEKSLKALDEKVNEVATKKKGWFS